VTATLNILAKLAGRFLAGRLLAGGLLELGGVIQYGDGGTSPSAQTH